MVQLSREQAQRVIYRGCARLTKAMQIKASDKDMAQKWEDEALREARTVLVAAMNGPLTDLIIPPLPFAIFEVQKRLGNRRPLQPCDVDSPFEQASTSPWAIWMADENDPNIPSHTDLGDPSTFWWKDIEDSESTTRNAIPTHAIPLRDTDKQGTTLVEDSDESGSVELKCRLRSATNLKRSLARTNVDESESEQPSIARKPGPRTRSSKRHRVEAPSSEDEDEHEDRYVYVPKCDQCRDRGLVCHVVGLGQCACTPCRIRKRRCSAYQGKNRVVRRNTPFYHDRKRKVKKESIIDWLRPSESVGLTRTPFKQKHESSSEAPARPAEQLKIGPPGERAASTRRSPIPSGSQAPTLGMIVPSTSTTRTSGAATSLPVATPAVLVPASATTTATPKRVLLDKSVATESQPLERFGPQEAENMKGLVSLVLEVKVRTHQSDPSIACTVSVSAGEAGSAPTIDLRLEGEGVGKRQSK